MKQLKCTLFYKVILCVLCCFMPFLVFAVETVDLDVALQNTYRACVGIDDDLADLKKMAGINTAVTAVGTATGAAAVATGIAKVQTDKEIEEFEIYLQKIENAARQQTEEPSVINVKQEQIDALFAKYYKEEVVDDKIEELNKKSKKLGNWRTGLMAGTVATNVTGAIIAGKNKVDSDLLTKIDVCKSSVAVLDSAINQARMNGENVGEAQDILNTCKEYNYVDLTPISKHAKGAMISSLVGTATGVAGTVTSAVANTDNVRDDDTDAGKQKEKNLNTSSNVLAGASAAASATAVFFNAAQISAIKKVSLVAQKCTEMLK